MTDPEGQGPTGQGPTGQGPAGQGPTGRGPTGKGPTGKGPTGKGPTGKGPTGKGPGDARPTPEPEPGSELDIDSAFAAIIAEFSVDLPNGEHPWPASEDLHDADEPDQPAAEPSAAATGSTAVPGEVGKHREDDERRRIVLPGTDSSVVDEDDEEEEGYVPPVPPPIPSGDLVFRLAWAGVLGGPLFLLVAALTWRTLPSFLLFVALMAFIGGFVTLVARMPADRPDDPDDGAIV